MSGLTKENLDKHTSDGVFHSPPRAMGTSIPHCLPHCHLYNTFLPPQHARRCSLYPHPFPLLSEALVITQSSFRIVPLFGP
ncbi:hypothetical protein I302_101176 [Kwoniella bestiolae CBS 10118]|uniref:Uncharacterized protein n=1 Tax=Kwoniella bestiolae CBS 10118 TaxID=1296100 RepID=A0AAJ8K1L7_9TREE